MATSKVGKRGTVVIPAQLRQRFDLHEGALVVIEAQEDGVLIRPAVVVPLDSELRRRWLQETNAAYAALQADPAAWQAELAEHAAWDATLMDGLDTQELWSELLPPWEVRESQPQCQRYGPSTETAWLA